MNNKGIDDIRIDVSYKQKNESRKGFIIFWVLLLLIFCGLLGFNYYSEYLNNSISKKNLFFKQIARTNVKDFLSNELFETMYSGILNNSYEIDNNINFDSNIENFSSKYLKGLDLSNFIINLNTKKDSTESKSFSEGHLEYSGNDILDFKINSTKDEIAFYSKDIYDRYISLNYDDINKVFNSNLNTNLLKDKNKLELSKSEILGYISDYKELILQNLKEEYFFVDNNGILKDSDGEIEVTSYSLEIDQQELSSILIEVLEKIKKDDKLIDKIISGKDEAVIINIDQSSQESSPSIIKNFKINGEVVETKTELEELKSDIINILAGKKIDISYGNFIQKINKLSDYIKNNDLGDLKIRIYSSEKRVERMSINFFYTKNIELKFQKDLSNDKTKNIKITFLDTGKNNGFSLDIEKTENSASLLYDVAYNFIEQGVINRKVNINLKTDGTIDSNFFNNDIVISYLTNNGEAKWAIKNTIKFVKEIEVEDLNDLNCLYLSRLSESDYDFCLQDLHGKILDFYNSKREKLNFIDINTITGRNDINSITVDEARTALYNTVYNMALEAIEEGREITLQDLRDLSIDGYDVSVSLNEENAIIIVDIYMFKIDKDFNLFDM